MNRTVLAESPTWIVGNFPYIAIRVGEGSGGASPLCHRRRAHDSASGAVGLRQSLSDLLGGADVVGKVDAWCAVATEGSPQAQHQTPGLEEADIIVRVRSSDNFC